MSILLNFQPIVEATEKAAGISSLQEINAAKAELVRIWLVPVTAALSLISTSIAIWTGILAYRLKAKAERRMRDASNAKIDVDLSKLFTDIGWVAHARDESAISEHLVQAAIGSPIVTNLIQQGQFDKARRLIEQLAVLHTPVGVASQNAAIQSLAVLGKKYDVLKEPARAALLSIKGFKPQEAQAALDLLESTGTAK
jgi:hypothetical protein